MQNLFNQRKRKHDEGSDVEKQNKRHKEQVGGPESPKIRHSLETRGKDLRIPNGSVTSLQTRKIANLIKALDEALEDDVMDQTLDLIGDEALNQCLDLSKSLSTARSMIIASPSSSSLEQESHDFFNVPQNNPTASTFCITPWKSSTIPTTLPPLPKVFDPTLEESAFIHLGCGSGKPTDLNYERLEWVGDIYLELVATLLISQTFPNMGPGKASQLRERLVKNITLADLSRQYRFDERLRMPVPKFKPGPLEDKTKILGDIFEAYVAAVILSDPVTGFSRAAEWLKGLWGMLIIKDIIQEERNGLKLESPLWKLRGAVDSREEASLSDMTVIPLNPKEHFQKLLGIKGVRIAYKDAGPEKKDPISKMPVFTVGLYLTGLGEKEKMLGIGKAGSKKEAGFKAAEAAMANKKMMKHYLDKRKLIETQRQLEKDALVAQEGC
ncbi:hypothetical protein PZA11_003363 [Diplocarpon coronariae]|uniref:RNase III domain-containing protein n=1 Tax=Diplocarpon coronariae TaxID=2795749 RepID=A0A218YTL3_9HELO|nr:hypothetical protein JHW43_000705 [Diplocarpon mali]OWO98639.1 hypothetical protein B2J93_5796 [Marssonina coronariae]